jgi:hypothetical protein
LALQHICLFIPLLGSLLIVALLPDQSSNHSSYKSSSSGGNLSGSDLSKIASINPDNNSGDKWVCQKCNETNPISSLSCKGCGVYK